LANSKLEERLLAAILAAGMDRPERDYQFLRPIRRLEIDFAWKPLRLGIEVQGGTWKKGKTAHSWGPGQRRDADKLNLAATNAWTIMYATPDMLTNKRIGEFISLVIVAYEQRGGERADGC